MVKKGDHRSNGFVTDPRKLLIWWPMATVSDPDAPAAGRPATTTLASLL
jgi:hypothetical protein